MSIQDFGLRRAHILYGEISVYFLGSPCSHCDATWVTTIFRGVRLGHDDDCPLSGDPDQDYVALPRALSPTYNRPGPVFARRHV